MRFHLPCSHYNSYFPLLTYCACAKDCQVHVRFRILSRCADVFLRITAFFFNFHSEVISDLINECPTSRQVGGARAHAEMPVTSSALLDQIHLSGEVPCASFQPHPLKANICTSCSKLINKHSAASIPDDDCLLRVCACVRVCMFVVCLCVCSYIHAHYFSPIYSVKVYRLVAGILQQHTTPAFQCHSYIHALYIHDTFALIGLSLCSYSPTPRTSSWFSSVYPTIAY